MLAAVSHAHRRFLDLSSMRFKVGWNRVEELQIHACVGL